MNARRVVSGIAVSGMALAFAFTLPALAQRGVPAERSCDFGAPGQPLSLREAVERGLCNNPKTRAAWFGMKAQVAALGVARAAFLPTLSGNWQGVRNNAATYVSGQPQLDSHTAATIRSASVSLNWVLFDFGSRAAALDSASDLLVAAKATHDAALLAEFARIARSYHAAQAAQGALAAAADIERLTRGSLVAAQARVDRGVAPITDMLQAQTQHDEAVFNQVKAQGDVKITFGSLASDMGLDPYVSLNIPPVTVNSPNDETFSESVEKLIDEVKRTHPRVLAAQAQFEAAQASIARTRAQGLPSVSLVAKYSRNNQPTNLGMGVPTFPATGHDAYIGVQVSIPFFEGFGWHYQIRQVRAEAERQRYAADEVRQQVALDVWTGYETLRMATQQAKYSETLLSITRRSFAVAEHRYRTGVGNILELLNTQTALAAAQQRRVQALADWQDSKIQLAARLGRLDMSNLD